MAVRLLEMAKNLQPQEYKRLAHKTSMRPDGPGRWVGIPNEMANLAHEITCQNGAEVITALFEQLSKANTTGGPIRVGGVEEQNAHAVAYAAAHQLANEVLEGKPLSITVADLERLDQLVCAEACAVADERSAVPKGRRRVMLRGPGDRPIVNSVEKRPLTLAQYDVVKALLEAGERGLSKDELDRKSKHGDARRILKRLAESDSDWKAVISFPGLPGGGYRIG
jgi:hypothetical protein